MPTAGVAGSLIFFRDSLLRRRCGFVRNRSILGQRARYVLIWYLRLIYSVGLLSRLPLLRCPSVMRLSVLVPFVLLPLVASQSSTNTSLRATITTPPATLSLTTSLETITLATHSGNQTIQLVTVIPIVFNVSITSTTSATPTASSTASATPTPTPTPIVLVSTLFLPLQNTTQILCRTLELILPLPSWASS